MKERVWSYRPVRRGEYAVTCNGVDWADVGLIGGQLTHPSVQMLEITRAFARVQGGVVEIGGRRVEVDAA